MNIVKAFDKVCLVLSVPCMLLSVEWQQVDFTPGDSGVYAIVDKISKIKLNCLFKFNRKTVYSSQSNWKLNTHINTFN